VQFLHLRSVHILRHTVPYLRVSPMPIPSEPKAVIIATRKSEPVTANPWLTAWISERVQFFTVKAPVFFRS
jgi:hypothetical protein